jgi:hypothetical protein
MHYYVILPYAYHKVLFRGTKGEALDFLWKYTVKEYDQPSTGYVKGDTVYTYLGGEVYTKGCYSQTDHGSEAFVISHRALRKQKELHESVKQYILSNYKEMANKGLLKPRVNKKAQLSGISG